MALHQLNLCDYSRFSERDLCLALKKNDAILLLEDAVLKVLNTNDPILLAAQTQSISVHALESDLLAYGVSAPEWLQVLTPAQWVLLTSQHQPIVSW